MYNYIAAAAALYTTLFSHYIVKWLVVLDLEIISGLIGT